MKKLKNYIQTAVILLTLACTGVHACAVSYKYDNLNRLTEVIYDNGQKVTYTYDAGGNILTATNTKAEKALTSIAFDAASYALAVGEKRNLVLTATYSDGSKAKVTESAIYKTSNKAIATVSNAGLVKGVANGQATITATYGGKTVKATVALGVLPGDVNDDGRVNSVDVLRLKQYILGLVDENEINLKAADINQDGKVNSVDLMLLKRDILGIE